MINGIDSLAFQLASIGEQTHDHEHAPKPKRYDWARLLARVFAVEVLTCPKCKTGMQRIAFVIQPDAIRKILSSVGLPADSPRPSPSRRVHQEDLLATA